VLLRELEIQPTPQALFQGAEDWIKERKLTYYFG
jgi:hypothetical protein